jgi:hypothetical protein
MKFDSASDFIELLNLTRKLFCLQRTFLLHQYYTRASRQLALLELWEQWVQNLRSPTYRAWALHLKVKRRNFKELKKNLKRLF